MVALCAERSHPNNTLITTTGGLSHNDALNALGDYFAKASGPEIGTGLTGPEIAVRMGCSENAARKKIREGMAQGVLEHVTVERTRVDGRRTFIVGYRMTQATLQARAAIAALPPGPKAALPKPRPTSKKRRTGKKRP